MNKRRKFKVGEHFKFPVSDRLRTQSPHLLIPNIVTISALCMGLSSLRFASLARWDLAIGAICAAAVLDVLDGRLARLFKSTSDFGAELDSIADFASFGIAPGLLIYNYSVHNLNYVGWGLCLFFIVCCGLRLARFNVSRISNIDQSDNNKGYYFVGVPAPAGAILALSPLIFDLEFHILERNFIMWLSVLSLFCSGLLMISRVRTPSLKGFSVSSKKIIPALAGVGVVVAFFIGAPWLTLLCLVVAYLFVILLTMGYKSKEGSKQDISIKNDSAKNN